jgi:perosamine synthetase
MDTYIPLSVPNISGNEWKYVKECLDTGWVSSAGPFVNRFEDEFAKYVGAKHAVACSSGTAALHVSLQLAGVQAGDLVIAPTLTFIASINAIRYLGAEPYFFDADRFYNISAKQVLQFLKNETSSNGKETIHRKTGKKIAAVMAVHVFGNAADLFSLATYCSENGIPLIEDSAESLGTTYNETASVEFQKKHTGTIGTIGCFSFNGNKILTTGGGGMIVTNNGALAKKAKYLTTQSKDDELYFVHNEIGYNYRMTNIQAAMGVAQLEKMPEFLAQKRRIYEIYQQNFADVPGVTLAPLPSYANNNCWLTCLQIDAERFGTSRDELLSHLQKKKIESRPVWQLNHLQRPYKDFQQMPTEVATNLWETTVSIPCSTSMTSDQQKRVIETILALKK